MVGMGTIINVGAIIIGGILGLLFGNLLQKRYQEILMTAAALSNLSMVGSMMIFCVGANLLWDLKIRVANMLPVLVIAVIWAFL